MSNSFTWPVRVYYEDTDSGGVVYHSNYLNFMERARTEWLRSLGFVQTELRRTQGVIFVVREIGIKYHLPARFNDELQVHTELAGVGRSLLRFRQTIVLGNEILTEAEVQVVCIDAERFKPVALPSSIREKIMEPE
jgi:acyl-CoA thioester hydrolase